MPNLSTDFLAYLRNKSAQINDAVLERAKDCLYDYLAVTTAGARANRDRWGTYYYHIPKGNFLIEGLSLMTDRSTSCLLNGFHAHILELDDGQRFAMIHLGAAIVTAVEAVRAENSLEYEDVLRGIVMGYEAACRVALAVQPAHKKKGFHTAGTCGTIGAAIGAGYALGMDDVQLRTVLDCAVASAAGMLEIQEQGSELKPYNLGRAALDGVNAAYMGYSGWKGPDDMLGGERGFLALFADGGNPAKATEATDYFEIERIYVKPYAACRHCHSAIEAALTLREQCDPDGIERVVIETYHLAVKGHDHTDIAGVSSAKLSMPYSVAAALVLGRADVAAFDADTITNERILALTRKVKVEENPEFSAQSSQKRIANVIIFKKDGSFCEQRVDYAKGDPENPMSRADIRRKAEQLLGRGVAYALALRAYRTEAACGGFPKG